MDIVGFNKEIRSIIDTRAPISASKMTLLVKYAIKLAASAHSQVTDSIRNFAKDAPTECKLSGLYIIDAIVRAAIKTTGDAAVYRSDFESSIEELLSLLCIQGVSEKDLTRMKKVIAIWKKGQIFNIDLLNRIDQTYFAHICKSSSLIQNLNSFAHNHSFKQQHLKNLILLQVKILYLKSHPFLLLHQILLLYQQTLVALKIQEFGEMIMLQ